MSDIIFLNVKSTNEVVFEFLRFKKNHHCTQNTLKFYKQKLSLFEQYFNTIDEVTVIGLRAFFYRIQDEHHYKPSTQRAIYQAIKVFLGWIEYMDEDFKNPIYRIIPPKIPVKVLDPLSVEDLKKMLSVCNLRDASILMMMADCGARSNEILSINIQDCNFFTGEVLLRKTKNGKQRTVYVGHKTLKALRKYLKTRKDKDLALFVSWNGRLTYSALNRMIKARAKQANVEPPTLHSLRRFATLSMVRNNIPLPALMDILGHSSYGNLHRYLKLQGEDIQNAYAKSSPIDNM
jgi:integrase/recombinase XerD